MRTASQSARACRCVAVLSATGSAGAFPSLRTLCRSHRDSNRAPLYRRPLRGLSGSGFDDQVWQTDAVNPGIFWESPHPLSIVGVNNESHARIQLARMPFHLGHDVARPVPALRLIAEASVVTS